MPRPIKKYAAKIPAIYVPPIWRIFLLSICIPNRNAMVMRRMENEQGCTLSRSAEIRTSGRSQAPLLLKFQINEAVPELCLKRTIPTIATAMIINIVVILLITITASLLLLSRAGAFLRLYQ